MTGHKYALQKIAKILCVCVCVCVCGFMSILLFASGDMPACACLAYISIHSVTCVSGLVIHGCIILLNETNLKLLFTGR